MIDQHGSQNGWSESEREVMALTDALYERLAAEGKRRPTRAAVREAARSLGEGIEAVYRREADGRNWRRSCRAAANELGRDAYEALATISVAGSDMSRGIAGAEQRRARKHKERGLMDALFAEVRALRKQGVARADTAEALYRLDPEVVLGCLEGERPFAAALLERYGAESVTDTADLACALVVAASPVPRVRELRPEVGAMRARVAAGEFTDEEAVAELRSRAVRRRPRGPKPSAPSPPELPAPVRSEPDRVWEFPAFCELAEAMRPALPAGEGESA